MALSEKQWIMLYLGWAGLTVVFIDGIVMRIARAKEAERELLRLRKVHHE